MGIGGDKNVTDGKHGNGSRYQATENKFNQCKQNSIKGDIRIRSGHINHKSEWLEIK